MEKLKKKVKGFDESLNSRHENINLDLDQHATDSKEVFESITALFTESFNQCIEVIEDNKSSISEISKIWSNFKSISKFNYSKLNGEFEAKIYKVFWWIGTGTIELL